MYPAVNPSLRRGVLAREKKAPVCEIPVSLVRLLRRIYPQKAVRRLILRSLAHPSFPLTFLIRNFDSLEREGFWKDRPFRVRKKLAQRLLQERAACFAEVLAAMKPKPDMAESWGFAPEPSPGEYCTHCGGCCEIASGLPDFPRDAPVSRRWKRLFGEGLGKGHRFCPFLLEHRGRGRSFCAIHPWRPQPCRLFGSEECAFLLGDPDFSENPGYSPGDGGVYRALMKNL